MNVSILFSSFKYIYIYRLVVSLSTWINDQTTKVKFKNSIVARSFVKHDYEVTEALYSLVTDKSNRMLKCIVSITHSQSIYNYSALVQDLIQNNSFVTADRCDDEYDRNCFVPMIQELVKYIAETDIVIFDNCEYGKILLSIL